jgi:short-subunit dehydrogenase
MKDFKNKVVIITGASSGIGHSLAIEFAKQGAKLSLGARREELLNKLKLEIQNEYNVEVLVTKTDVSKQEECENLITQTIKKFNTIDLLINNAGISMRALFLDVDLSVLKKVMDVNFWGTVYCTKFALPYLLKNKGVIVGVSSVAGFHGLPGRTGYSASKFAIHGFLESIRIEYLKTGLHVMIIAPGFTASEVREHALNEKGQEQGETPRKEEKMMSSERVAKILIKAIKNKKRNKILTLAGQFVALFQRIIPEQIDSMILKDMLKEPDTPLTKVNDLNK